MADPPAKRPCLDINKSSRDLLYLLRKNNDSRDYSTINSLLKNILTEYCHSPDMLEALYQSRFMDSFVTLMCSKKLPSYLANTILSVLNYISVHRELLNDILKSNALNLVISNFMADPSCFCRSLRFINEVKGDGTTVRFKDGVLKNTLRYSEHHFLNTEGQNQDQDKKVVLIFNLLVTFITGFSDKIILSF